jgi:hypothetical protein
MVAVMTAWLGLLPLVEGATVQAIDYRSPTVQSLFNFTPYFINPFLDLSQKFGSNTTKEGQ